MSTIWNASSAEDIKKRIMELARAYVPEWHFDEDDPDIGSVIAKLFALQTEENLRLTERLPERYHMEFVNMLDISLKAAQPAASIVLFEPTDVNAPGTILRRGTRLSAESENTENGTVVFETDRDLFVTGASVVDAFQTDGDRGIMTPLLGNFERPEVFPAPEASEEAPPELGALETEAPRVRPFTLFGERDNISQHALRLWHSRFFDGVGEPMYLRFKDSPELVQGVLEGKFRVRYAAEDGPRDFKRISLDRDGETLVLVKDGKCRRFPAGSEEETLAMVAVEAAQPILENITVREVLLSASGAITPPEYVGDGTADMNAAGFAPFSDTLAVYNECYIGQDNCFSKAGARVSFSFRASFRDHMIRLTPEEEEEELKIIKRKPSRVWSDNPARVAVEEIALEYFNGIGWRKLECDTEYAGLFEAQRAGAYQLSFLCPADWHPIEIGSFSGRCIRLRLMKADNAFMRPALHSYPYLTQVQFSYSYEGHFEPPARLERVSGTDMEDITGRQSMGKRYAVMTPFPYREDALYLGLNRRPEDGPVSLYFQLSDVSNQSGVHCRYEYSTISGFKEMRVMDYTDDFTKPGIVMFLPPPDMAPVTLEHKNRVWIRVVRAGLDRSGSNLAFLPRIARLDLNAVTVTNVQTGEEQDFYMDEVLPNMSFALGGTNVLDAEVWVNELGTLSEAQMRKLLADNPERVRAEYDLLGRFSAFFVRWNETDSFEGAADRRSYRIDRMTDRIHFADGVYCDLPRVTDGVAFRVRIRTTDGADGNLPAGSIQDLLGSAPFIDGLYNPIRTHGGGDLETVEHALARGAGIMHSRERLVSADDYVRFVMEYSESIERAAVVVGKTISGEEDPSDISVVLLMKDCMEGSFSFHRIESGLYRQMLQRCELALPEEHLHIVEPIFVSLSVNVWIRIMDMDESFEVQSDVRQVLTDYLQPVSGKGHDGWPIGIMPKVSQIMMRLGILKSRAIVRRLSIIAGWRDASGYHEADLWDLAVTPFMVCCNGQHRVSVIFD